ncbi:MAG: TIGR02206 family membrane protein [Anaerolineae bacterium]|nr:TIGR02206 family membrane protein [Anaerolineae bacterium]
MSQYFALDYTGEPFVLFGKAHLIYLALVALAGAAMFFWKPGEKTRRAFRIGLGVALIVNELIWHIWNIAVGTWSPQTMLPLHLCAVLVWMMPIMLFTRSYKLYEFAYFLALGAATQALLTPDIGLYGFPHMRFFVNNGSHALMVISACFMTGVEGFRPTWKSLRKTLIGLFLYAIPVFGINMLLGSNYLFINHKPETASLIDVLPEWPWYLIHLMVIAVVLFTLLYLPFAIKDWRASRAAARVEAAGI